MLEARLAFPAIPRSESKEGISPNKLIFVDFNGVLSQSSFWHRLTDESHPLSAYYQRFQELLFQRGEKRIDGLVSDWMVGGYTSEQIHEILSRLTGAPYEEIFRIFIEDCKAIDVSSKILDAVGGLDPSWYKILRTDNMDGFHRFILPENPRFVETFDSIHSSYLIHGLKRSDGGAYFPNIANTLGIEMGSSYLFDDSEKNCEIFVGLGGNAVQVTSEDQAVTAIESLYLLP